MNATQFVRTTTEQPPLPLRRVTSSRYRIVTQFKAASYLAVLALLIHVSAGGLQLNAYLAVGSLAAVVWMAFRTGVPAIILWIGITQWLQVGFAAVIGSGSWNAESSSSRHNALSSAQALSLLAVVVLVAGLSTTLASGKLRERGGGRHETEGRSMSGHISPPLTYLALLILSLSTHYLALNAGPLRALSSALPAARVAAFTAWAYTIFVRTDQRKKIFWAALAGETIAAVSGMFFGLRGIVVALLVANISAAIESRRRVHLLPAVILLVAGAYLAVSWTAVKSGYRSQILYADTQQYSMSATDRLGTLFDEVAQVDSEAMSDASEALLRRISYIEYFGLVMARVPDVIPHTSGAIWLDSISRALQPRLLFPGKSAVHDSERTAYFTGIAVAGVDRGTSVSLGYPCESYIDFGPIWMFLPIFALGLMAGFITRLLIVRCATLSGFRAGVALLVLGPLAPLESSVTKTLPSLGITALVALLILWWAPRLGQVRIASAHHRVFRRGGAFVRT